MQKKYNENHLKSYAVKSIIGREEFTKNLKILLDLPIKEIEIESFTQHHLEDLNTKIWPKS